MINLLKLRPEIERVCRVLPIKRLGLFGFVLTQNFTPSSDGDVLVLFDSDENIDLLDVSVSPLTETRIPMTETNGRHLPRVSA